MFEFRPDQMSAVRRKRIGAAFATSFSGTSLQAQVEPSTGDVLVTPSRGHPTRYSFDGQGLYWPDHHTPWTDLATPERRTGPHDRT